MKKNLLTNFVLTSFVLVACFISCQSGDNLGDDPDSPESKPRQDIPLTKAEKAMAEGNNTFAFGLLQAVAKADKKSDHIFVSPLSAGLAFGMLSNGTAGATFDEIRQTFGFAGASNEEINDYYRKMLTELTAVDPEVALESANSIWINDDFPVLDAFVKTNQAKYDAEVRNEDFSDPATLKLINAWCANKTHDKIDRILDEVSDASLMYLLNALYFKGMWSLPFKKELTQDATFTNEDGSTSSVPMMHRHLRFNYFEGSGFELAEMPYGNEAFSMVFLLPAEGATVGSVAESLDASVWNDCLSQLQQRSMDISLPRMNLAYEITLNDALRDMGMALIFDETKADFSRINPDVPLVVSLVKQKTTLVINEEGSEASAVTVIEMAEAAGDIPPSLEFNRPFLFFIKEKSTDIILFAGYAKKL
ncbi:MAG: serpin family protein [Tannerellaceae bacterium]|jgi:serpin B|nr:serpin family protein [Tannerellaceae bacterium]